MKRILVILVCSAVSLFVNNLVGALELSESSMEYDLNSDGKIDGIITVYEFSDKMKDKFFSQRGRDYKKAEFDTNFDGNMDIIISFGRRYGCLKKDIDFDGKVDIENGLIHQDPEFVVSTVWPGRLDTWYIIENYKQACNHVKEGQVEEFKIYEEELPPELRKLVSKATTLEEFLQSSYFSKVKEQFK